MKASERGITLIKTFEGLELEAYQDVAGVWTIGYGHTGDIAEEGAVITAEVAETLLVQDLFRFEAAVNDLVTVPINQNEFDALVSLSFNIGVGAFSGSTCLRWLNEGDRINAARALQWWNKATVNRVLREVMGLTRRRAAEAELFLTPARKITPQINTAKVKPEGEAKPGPRLRCQVFDRAQLRN